MSHRISISSVVAAFVVVALSDATAHAQNLPEGPAIWREVSGIENITASGWDPAFLRPHVPSFRTTRDGRVCCNVKGVPRFTLLMPENLDGEAEPLLHQPAGAYTLSLDNRAAPNAGYVGGSEAEAEDILTGGTGRNVLHGCLWDDALPTSNAEGQDVYALKALVATNDPGGAGPRSLQIFVTELTVVVDQPKTTNATIASVVVTPGTTTSAGPVYDSSPNVTRQFLGSGFEPTIAGDGRLLVFRVVSNNLPVGPAGNTTPESIDIVYSYYEGGETADPTRWLDVYPIAHAHHDPRINTKFGFALFPLLDPRGYPIPDWEDMGGTYPWIDRAAKNLFFTSVRSLLHTAKSNWTAGRYPLRPLPGDPNVHFGSEDPGATRGVTFAGLWSRGKMVLVDNLNSNMDYAIGNEGAPVLPLYVGPQQRVVQLYSDGASSPSGDPGEIQLGYGRASYNPAIPEGENGNSTILQSMENELNYKRGALPIAPRDVVWFVQNGLHTDQLVFDDYLDPDALVIASMAGLLRFPVDVSGKGYNVFRYDDGWNAAQELFGEPAAFPIRVQNAATAHHRWALPGWGQMLHSGGGRLEPVAAGGVHGKGLWLEDGVGLVFVMPSQAGAPSGLDASERAKTVSLFVDCRFDDDGADRLLLTFTDQSKLLLRGRSQIVFADANGPVHFANVPSAFTHTSPNPPSPFAFLPKRGWSHLGLRIEDAGHAVTLFLDGLPLSRWSHPAATLFDVEDGDLVVGDLGASYPGASFRGWIDDFKILLRDVDPETACNHAGGTLVGVRAGAGASSWARRFAQSFPAWAHAEITRELRARGEDAYALYANFHDPSRDDGVYAGVLPADADPLAAAIHFPEGPLFRDRPRPDSSTNRFCLSCHTSDEARGLTLDALDYDGALFAPDDPRRQPMQPPARLSGFVPAGLVNAGATAEPAQAVNLGAATRAVDDWLMPARGATASTVESVFVVAAGSGEPLVELDPTSRVTLDPAVLGTRDFTLRAQLDSAQGAVALELKLPGRKPRASLVQSVDVPVAPYTIFKRAQDPFHGRRLRPGDHTLRVTPDGGRARTYDFRVLGEAPRKIAGYREDFRAGAARAGWFYLWNALGAVDAPTRRLALSWNATEAKYTETGADWPNALPSELAHGSLHATGGWPGRGTAQPGVTSDRFVVAGYRVAADGFASIEALDVAPLAAESNGVRVLVLRETSGALTVLDDAGVATQPAPLANHATARFPVTAGDVVWIAIGPEGDSTADAFDLDFEVWFGERSW